MKTKIIGLIFAASLLAGLGHEMVWAEGKCAELGNTPQECAILSNDSL